MECCVHIKHYKVLIETIAEIINKKGMRTNTVVHVEKEEERNPEVGMMMRRWTKEVKKLVMRCFYQNNPKTNDCYLERNRNF